MRRLVSILLFGAVMTFNTGNAVGSTDPRDLYDNAANFDIAANSMEETFQDRLGRSRLTYKGIESAASTGNPAVAAAAQAVAAAQEATAAAAQAESALSQVDEAVTGVAEQAASAATGLASDAADRAEAAATAAQVSAGIFASTAAGVSATTEGEYFSVPASNTTEYLVLYRNLSGVATEVKRYPSAAIDALSINQAKVFPERVMTRAGVTSSVRTTLTSALLDVEVHGARAGKYYRIGFFKNGTTLVNGPPDGWIIEEHSAATFASGPDAPLTVVAAQDPAPDIPRSGVQTVVVNSPNVPGLSFKITLDTARLPAYGTHISGNTSAQPGYSYIIDPNRYYQSAASAIPQVYPLQWSTDASSLYVAWASKSNCYRIKFGPVGVNGLPNIAQTWIASGTDLGSASWVSIMSTGSDHLPPMQVAAINNGDGGSLAFTGGSHGSTGGSDGDPTASNKLFQILADGAPVGFNRSGYATAVTVNVINELQGYNTKTTARPIIRQAFNIEFWPGGMTVQADVNAIEPVRIYTDYALQTLTFGYQGTQLVLGGDNVAREAFINGTANDSGAKSAYPNAWALVLQEPTNGQLTLWMDREYEVGDGRYVDNTAPLVFASDLGKWYLGAVRSAAGQQFAAGAGYKYRAGLSWQSAGIQPSGYDSIISMRIRGAVRFAYGLPSAAYVRP